MTTLAVAISLVIVIRNLTGLAGQLPDLRTRLNQVESLLEALLDGIPAVKEGLPVFFSAANGAIVLLVLRLLLPRLLAIESMGDL